MNQTPIQALTKHKQLTNVISILDELITTTNVKVKNSKVNRIDGNRYIARSSKNLHNTKIKSKSSQKQGKNKPKLIINTLQSVSSGTN